VGEGSERPPRKREYDRRSSTGRSGEQRKDGRGPRSFGNVFQEASDADKNPASAEPEIEPVDGVLPAATAEGDEGATPATPEVIEEVAPEPAEPEVVTFTFEEYLAKRNEARMNADAFGEIKPVRVVEADFSGLKTVKEDLDDLLKLGGGKKEKDKKTTQRSTAKTAVLDVGFKRPEVETGDDDHRGGRGDRGDRPPRSGRGEGGRGGGRGRGRGDGNSERAPRASGSRVNININDADSFPSL